ncbi:hypothetical protein JYP52_01230 [Nitratireductor aquibiodomus]|uniref:hypothetical protein n=1 Tax=Nitratireductor aquibiodomus TaxID=204799 RepID=UPI0019D376F0|nr:hypothetical protein [Nitratireductor aquibiodomus]MBN7759744.1 hypothetical protein [Nitratireductor aquibiodomus]
MNRKQELMPCPLCGSKTELRGGPEAQEFYSIWCGNRECLIHVEGTLDREKTVAKWNRRASSAEAVAWRRDWNFRGHPCAPEFTDSPGLAEQWETHPQTDKVTPLHTSPADEAAVDDLPWTDLKVAFDVVSDSAFWDAYVAGDLQLPDGWEINETDCSGARCVAVFRVNRLPTTSDGRAVADLLATLPTKGKTDGQTD